jgi:hypothetical protein
MNAAACSHDAGRISIKWFDVPGRDELAGRLHPIG